MITDLREASHLLTAQEIVVDVETDTQEPAWFGKGYGLSYCADITYISMLAPGFPPVVINMMDGDIEEKRRFVKAALTNPYLEKIINHNVIFDLRLLGGHYGFQIPMHVGVWDTQTIGILLLMGTAGTDTISLESLTTRHKLVKDDELAFLSGMKKVRFTLHTQQQQNVLEYVALDTILTERLYQLQKLLIAETENTLNDIEVVTADTFKIVPRTRTQEVNYFSTKNYKNLQDLINWEMKISRWGANSAITGIRLDHEYIEYHFKQLMQEYSDSLKRIVDQFLGELERDCQEGVCTLLWFDQILTSLKDGRVLPLKPSRFIYMAKELENGLTSIGLIFNEEMPEDVTHAWVDYLWHYSEKPPKPTGDVPSLNLQMWFKEFLNNRSFDQQENLTTRLGYKVDWYRHYFSLTKEIEPSVLVNKKLFAPYFVFCLAGCRFPSDLDLLTEIDLATPKLKQALQDGEIPDNFDNFIDAAISENALSMSTDALKYFIRNQFGDAELLNDFLIISDHASKMNRIEEFVKHSRRDGCVHSIIARKTRTGRASSVNMNLQNIRMDVYRGYILPDNDDHVLIGLDVSNAENFFAALSAGDNDLALACCSSDFHMEHTKIYWPDEYKALSERIAAGDHDAHDELKKLRKKSKFVTFASAYGAGNSKIAVLIGGTKEEAKEILERRDRRFPRYTQMKERRAQLAEQAYAAGARPTFTSLWTGRRVAVPHKRVTRNRWENGKVIKQEVDTIAGYKCANYLQQGGVSELIWRAIVELSEFLERENWDARVALQVHDEIIISAHKDIAFKVAQKVSEIIAEVVPEQLRNRTTPPTRFLAALGPENAKKWGWRFNREYLLPLDKFVNQWGVHDLPVGAEEAPIWINKDNSSINVEMNKAETAADISPAPIEVETTDKIKELNICYNALLDVSRVFYGMAIPRRLTVGDVDGVFDFPNQIVLMKTMLDRSLVEQQDYDNFMREIWQYKSQVDAFFECLKDILDE